MKTTACLILLILLTGCARDKTGFPVIVKAHINRYPGMEIADLYKLAYHAAMGNAHMGTDSSVIRNYLEGELERIEASRKEPLIEEISPDGSIVRLNLHTFKAMNGDIDELVRALVGSAQTCRESIDKLTQYCQSIIDMASAGQIPFDTGELESFFIEMRKYGFTPVHHSEFYREKYRPAYRVLLREFLPGKN